MQLQSVVLGWTLRNRRQHFYVSSVTSCSSNRTYRTTNCAIKHTNWTAICTICTITASTFCARRRQPHGPIPFQLADVVRWCCKVGIPHLSVYAFSIDNFRRTEEEVQQLMDMVTDKYRAMMQVRVPRSRVQGREMWLVQGGGWCRIT